MARLALRVLLLAMAVGEARLDCLNCSCGWPMRVRSRLQCCRPVETVFETRTAFN